MEEKKDILNEKNIKKYNFNLTVEGIDAIKTQMLKSVCKIMKEEETGTGFFCKLIFDNENGDKKFLYTLITNNHVIGKNDLSQRKEIFISWNNEIEDASLKLDNSRIKFTNENLDVTILELKEDDKINCSFLQIDPILKKEKKNIKKYLDEKPIYIIHYPKNINKKEYVYSSFGILNKIDENKSEINYFCSTDNGSSGSPILSLSTQQVIGLHKGTRERFNYNIGILMKDILDEFLNYLINQFLPRTKSLNINSKINNYIKDEFINNQNYNNLNQRNSKNIQINFDIQKNIKNSNLNNYKLNNDYDDNQTYNIKNIYNIENFEKLKNINNIKISNNKNLNIENINFVNYKYEKRNINYINSNNNYINNQIKNNLIINNFNNYNISNNNLNNNIYNNQNDKSNQNFNYNKNKINTINKKENNLHNNLYKIYNDSNDSNKIQFKTKENISKRNINRYNKLKNNNIFNKNKFKTVNKKKNNFENNYLSKLNNENYIFKTVNKKKNIFNNNLIEINNKYNNHKFNQINNFYNINNNNNLTKNDLNTNNALKNTNNTNKIISKENFCNLLKNYTIPLFHKSNYQFIKNLGEGSFGKIYLVKEKMTNKEYVIKIMYCKENYSLLLEYLKEFEILYIISNDNDNHNIIKVIGYSYQIHTLSTLLSELYLYILMEKAECDWEQEIQKRKKNRQYYTEKEIFLILNLLTSGLFFLQKNGIAHRDIKPQNILIFPNNIYKITDLGEAKMNLNNQKGKQTFTGTPYFMSPLLYNGLRQNKNTVNHNPFKSDVYSLGLCFLYAMTLNINVIKTIREIRYLENKEKDIKDNLKDLPNYSKRLWNIVFKMIEYEEDNRYDFIELEKHLPNFNVEKY